MSRADSEAATAVEVPLLVSGVAWALWLFLPTPVPIYKGSMFLGFWPVFMAYPGVCLWEMPILAVLSGFVVACHFGAAATTFWAAPGGGSSSVDEIGRRGTVRSTLP